MQKEQLRLFFVGRYTISNHELKLFSRLSLKGKSLVSTIRFSTCPEGEGSIKCQFRFFEKHVGQILFMLIIIMSMSFLDGKY
jgi:hypothetical protein